MTSQMPPWGNTPAQGPPNPVGHPPGDEDEGDRRAFGFLAVLLAVLLGFGVIMTVVGAFTHWWGLVHGPAPAYLQADAMQDSSFSRDDFTTENLAVNLEQYRNTIDHADDGAGGRVSGTVTVDDNPTLYGGTQQLNACDVPGMVDFFGSHRGKARAFAAVVGVSPDDLPAYLTGLTPVLLGHDTWVTNHGYDNGSATPFQAVLVAGTAVLIDDTGIPRARCAGGNPLSLPDHDRADLRAGNAPWRQYDPNHVVTVDPGEPMDSVPYVDIDSGEILERAPGSGRTGAIQATLTWDGRADIDLHVQPPSPAPELFWQNPASDGGELDIDMCIDPGVDCSDTHNIENVFWSSTTPPQGPYSAWAEVFRMHAQHSVPYTVKVYVRGTLVDTVSGTFTGPDQKSQAIDFSWN